MLNNVSLMSSLVFMAGLISVTLAQAASVKCMFVGGESNSIKTGEWSKVSDAMSIMQLFGVGGLTLKVNNTV